MERKLSVLLSKFNFHALKDGFQPLLIVANL